MRWQDMKDMFKECGSVDRADVFMDHQGRSKGCGIVVFQYEDDAQAAIEKFNGTEIFGRRIDVRLDQRTERS
jgi:RNA recognition motif-containing protein